MRPFFKTKLEIINREQACEIKILAVELTRKKSLEVLGFDLADPANQDQYRSFYTEDSSIIWNDHTGYSEHLNTDYVIDEIVHRFPDSDFIYSYYWDGPLVNREYIKGDYREELVQRTIDIGVDSPEAFARLACSLKEEQHYPFFIFPLGELLISKVGQAVEGTLARIAKIVPDQKLYCILVDNNDAEGTESYYEKGVFENGRIEWHEINDENYALIKTSKDIDVWAFNKPNEEVYKLFFIDSYREKVLDQIEKAEAEEKARAACRETEQEEDELPF